MRRPRGGPVRARPGGNAAAAPGAAGKQGQAEHRQAEHGEAARRPGVEHPDEGRFRLEVARKGRLPVDLAGEPEATLGGDGDRYIVNGQKVFISRIDHSDLMVLLARTTPVEEVEKFVPPRKTARHALRLIRDLFGHRPVHPGTRLRSGLDFINRVLRRRSGTAR